MSSPFELHGGSVIAMKGNECVCIATDMRLGEGKLVNIATNVPKVNCLLSQHNNHLNY
jgi:20S proteasome alpha/beta subunit